MATDTVDSMLKVFTKSSDMDFDYTNLYQMCMMASGFVKEIIKPWNLNFIDESTIKVLDFNRYVNNYHLQI